MPHRGDGGSGAQLHHDRTASVTQPGFLALRLLVGAGGKPVPIVEHHHVRARQTLAIRAEGKGAGHAAQRHVHDRLNALRGPDVVGARLHALQVMQ